MACGSDNGDEINIEAVGHDDRASENWFRWMRRSTHWLEGRGEEMVLVTMIDDATNRCLARFYDGETVEAYFDLVGRWLAKYGRPLAFYTDHDSIFETTSQGEQIQGMTQFGRADGGAWDRVDLGREPSGQGTCGTVTRNLQDRWVKLLRLAGVTTRAGGERARGPEALARPQPRFAKPASQSQ